MEIIEDKQNELLSRREVKILVSSEKNPGFPEASKAVAEQFKAIEELISVRGIRGKFGRDTFLITARIYKNKEDKENLEKKKEKKNLQVSAEKK